MDSSTEDLHLQKIEEFVYDEDKIVTFRWLSSALNINVNDSKGLLEKYVSDHRVSKPNDLAVTYLLSGIIEKGILGVTVVREDELEVKKKGIVKVLSKQIYSVQKCKQIDLNAVSLIDHFDMHNPSDVRFKGSITSKNCIKRNFKPKKVLPLPQPPTIKGKSSFFTKVPPKSTDRVDVKVKEEAASISKLNSTKEMDNTKQNQSKQVATPPKSKQNGIASFFTKGPVSVKNTSKSEEKLTKNIKTEEKVAKLEDVKPVEVETKDRMKDLLDTDSDSEDIISQTQNSNKSAIIEKPKRSYKRPKKESSKNAPSAKRRKRIVEHNDSDSDDIFGNERDENIQEDDVIENSDEDSAPVTKPKVLAPRNKKRKHVDRTFIDDEGYCITRREWVEESGSEEAAEPEPMDVDLTKDDVKKEVEKKEVVEEVEDVIEKKKKVDTKSENAAKVMNGKAKGNKGKKPVAANQKTLMSFFKKK